MGQGYNISKHMLITDPGKFEGEMYYVPEFYERGMNGFADVDTGHTWFFTVSEEDKKTYPELVDSYGLSLRETDQGFVIGTSYGTAGEYDSAVSYYSALEGEED